MSGDSLAHCLQLDFCDGLTVADARTQATQDADARIHQLEHELSSLLGAPARSGAGAKPVADAYAARSANTEMLNSRWGAQELARTEEFLAAARLPPEALRVVKKGGHDLTGGQGGDEACAAALDWLERDLER